MDTADQEKCVEAPSDVRHRPEDTVAEMVMPRPPSPVDACTMDANDTIAHRMDEDSIDREGLPVSNMLLVLCWVWLLIVLPVSFLKKGDLELNFRQFHT